MAQVSITKAAQIAGVQRSTLYRKNKKGELSFVKNSKGTDEIDVAELLRVYPNASIENPKNKHPKVTEHTDNKTELLLQENKFLLEKITDRGQLLEEAKDREENLLNKIDAVQKTVDKQTLLIEDYHNKNKVNNLETISKKEKEDLFDKNRKLQELLKEKEKSLREEQAKGFFKKLFG